MEAACWPRTRRGAQKGLLLSLASLSKRQIKRTFTLPTEFNQGVTQHKVDSKPLVASTVSCHVDEQRRGLSGRRFVRLVRKGDFVSVTMWIVSSCFHSQAQRDSTPLDGTGLITLDSAAGIGTAIRNYDAQLQQSIAPGQEEEPCCSISVPPTSTHHPGYLGEKYKGHELDCLLCRERKITVGTCAGDEAPSCRSSLGSDPGPLPPCNLRLLEHLLSAYFLYGYPLRRNPLVSSFQGCRLQWLNWVIAFAYPGLGDPADASARSSLLYRRGGPRNRLPRGQLIVSTSMAGTQ